MRDKKHLERINWLDHCSPSSSGWKSNNDILELTPVLIETVGWVVREEKKYLIIVAEHDPVNHNSSHATCIIKSCIKKRKKL